MRRKSELIGNIGQEFVAIVFRGLRVRKRARELTAMERPKKQLQSLMPLRGTQDHKNQLRFESNARDEQI
jgi:hypothetical protein